MPTAPVYVVLVRDPDRYSEEHCFLTVLENPEAGVPLRAFTDYEKADNFRRDRERVIRAASNPFRLGGWVYDVERLTHLDADRFYDWLLDADIRPPNRNPVDKWGLKLASWWEKKSSTLDEFQVAKIWEALDKVKFCVIVELWPEG